jgi:hypothetical protein
VLRKGGERSHAFAWLLLLGCLFFDPEYVIPFVFLVGRIDCSLFVAVVWGWGGERGWGGQGGTALAKGYAIPRSRWVAINVRIQRKRETMNSNVPQDVQATIASIVQPANGKQQRPSSQPVDSHSVSRRLVELWLPFPLFFKDRKIHGPVMD